MKIGKLEKNLYPRGWRYVVMRQSEVVFLMLSLLVLVVMAVSCAGPTATPTPTPMPIPTPTPTATGELERIVVVEAEGVTLRYQGESLWGTDEFSAILHPLLLVTAMPMFGGNCLHS